MSYYPVYSKVYLEVENDDWTVTPTTSLLHKIHQGHQSSVRWIAVLHYKQKEYRIAVGDPVRDTSQVLFAPSWFLQEMGVIGDGECLEVTFERAETLPKATRLRFRILGDTSTNMFEDMDLRDILETPLSQLGVIQKNQIIPVPISALHKLQVIDVEPADFVFLDGNEVAFEVEETPEKIAQQRQPTPFVSATQTPFTTPVFSGNQSMFDGPMISTISNAVGTLRTNPRAATQRNFIPFQGNGRTLSEK